MSQLKIVPLTSSSKGNATIISGASTNILVDCGISGKSLELCLEKADIPASEINAVVITHEHSDHIKGVGVISRKYNLPVFANLPTWHAMKESLGKVNAENIRVFESSASFYINEIKVTSFPIPHDAAAPVGFTFEHEVCKVSVATDMGIVTDTVLQAVIGSSAVLLEANYDPFMLDAGSYPYELKRRIKSETGHLSNDACADMARLLAQSGTKELILGHLSEENNLSQIALETVKACIGDFDVKLSIAADERKSRCNTAAFLA